MTLIILSHTKKDATIGHDGVSIKSSVDSPADSEPAKPTKVCALYQLFAFVFRQALLITKL